MLPKGSMSHDSKEGGVCHSVKPRALLACNLCLCRWPWHLSLSIDSDTDRVRPRGMLLTETLLYGFQGAPEQTPLTAVPRMGWHLEK
jgi:hypothetical protein